MAVMLIPQQARLTLNDAAGTPIAGGKVFYYRSGTTTLASIYTNEACTISASNPVIADSSGRVARVFFKDTYEVAAVIQRSTGGTVETIDPCPRYESRSLAADDITYAPIETNSADSVAGAINNNSIQIDANYNEVRPISRGGTGGNTAALARTSLGIGPFGVIPLRLLDTSDFNDVADGTYEYVEGSSPSNASDVVRTGILHQFTRADGTRVYQRASGVNSSGVHAVAGRDKVSGVWGAWYSILMTVES